jgi:hypothetical protein
MATAINLVYLKFSFAFEIGITIYGSRQFQLFLNENYHEVLYLRFAALHEMYNFDIEHEERNRKAIKPSLQRPRKHFESGGALTKRGTFVYDQNQTIL